MNLKQQDIADKLGISRGTLHRVLIGSPLVSEKTKQRVVEGLRKLNYVPNRAAQSLKSGRSRTIGVLGPARVRMANNLKMEGIYQTAERLGYSVIISYSDGSTAGDEKGIRELSSRMVDGIIILGRGLKQSAQHFHRFQETGKALISIYPVYNLKCDCVTLNTAGAFEKLTSYLIDKGHRRIGLVVFVPKSSHFTEARVKGYKAALKKAEIPVDPDYLVYASDEISAGKKLDYAEPLEDAEMDFASGFWGMRKLLNLKQWPTAVVCASDDTAIGALRMAHIEGVSVPDEMAVVGYDNLISSRYINPPLTTIDQNSWEMGVQAVEMLVARVEGKLRKRPVTQSMSYELVIRESCGGQK